MDVACNVHLPDCRESLNKIEEATLWTPVLINKIRNFRKVQQVYI